MIPNILSPITITQRQHTHNNNHYIMSTIYQKQVSKRRTQEISVEEAGNILSTSSNANYARMNKINHTHMDKVKMNTITETIIRTAGHCYCGSPFQRVKVPTGNWVVVCSVTQGALSRCIKQ